MYANRKSKRVVGAIAAFAAIAAGLVAAGTDVASAAALPANTAATGAATMAPTSGTAATSFGFTLPGGAACPGDGTAGYRWQTFIIPNASDASQLLFVGGSPSIGGSSTGINPLFSSGNPIVDQNPALTTGAVTVAGTNFQLSVFPSGTFTNNGIYKVGVACTDSLGNTQRYWQTKIATTVSGAGALTNFVVANAPATPSAPASLVNGVSQTLSGSVAFTAGTGALAVSSITVDATSSNGGAAGSVTVSGSPTSPASFSIAGLTNGKLYTLTATATNAAGSSAASAASTPAKLVYNANDKGSVTNVIATPVVGGLDLAWTAPVDALGVTNQPTDYTITVSPATIAAQTAAGTATSFSLTGLLSGTTYTVTVTPNFTAPATGAAGSSAGVPQSATLVTQVIDVTRPLGGLVLTQRCGVYGALPAETATNAFPAFAVAALVGTQDPNAPGLLTGGTAPALGSIVAGKFVPASPAASDSGFSQYPYPVDANGVPTNPGAVTYPTNCGLSLGIGELIKTGSEAGKYFRASGRLNQVTVVDTRNVDAGWTLQGAMSDFSSTTSADTFSGNYLGWTPVRNYDSGATLEGYDMTTTAGGVVQPDFTTGLKAAPKVLGSAAANVGLGIAAFDARVRLLIPVTKDNGVYTATLTISVL